MTSQNAFPLDHLDKISMETNWYVSARSDSKHELMFKPYVGQHPLGVTANALRIPFTSITLRYNDENDEYRLDAGTKHETVTVEPRISALIDAFTELTQTCNSHVFDEQLKQARRSSTEPKLSAPAKGILIECFDTLYDCVNTPPQDLETLSKFGTTRAQTVVDPDDEPYGAHPDWASYTHCPACTTEFWSTYPSTDKHREQYEERPPLSDLSNITFCPDCGFNNFSAAYLMNAVPFTDKHIVEQIPGTTQPVTPSGDRSLTSF